MTIATTSRRRRLLSWALWTAGFLVFPIAGLAGRAVGGPVDDLLAAALGGALTGLVLGAGQSLLARGAVQARRWIPATALGMAVGLGLGSAIVGYGTSLGDLALMGVLTGVPLGIAQALALPAYRLRWTWAVATPALWGLGWTITTLAGVDVESQYTIFGMSGAAVYTALSGLLLQLVPADRLQLRHTTPRRPRPVPRDRPALSRIATEHGDHPRPGPAPDHGESPGARDVQTPPLVPAAGRRRTGGIASGSSP